MPRPFFRAITCRLSWDFENSTVKDELKEFGGSYFSNNTGRFRLKPNLKNNFDPYYLETLFHSRFIQLQVKRAKAQTGQPKIADKETKNFLIPDLDVSLQRKISNKVQKAISNKKLSKQLLDIAKRGVELAIETDEKQAQKWIEENTTSLKHG